ncbi:RelA/SpoT domain-containing protein [Paraburkholderia sp.]|uniref:RelA/SpoT domain-containing protein n=1 Tax=Paraburkholderia sp. TaxID=1926495 RepID=UPI00286F8528|nr:RelA/SpoT domain-containing protein [Paraburkholderia sp.]
MYWATPEHSREKVNAAGRILVRKWDESLQIPLEEFDAYLDSTAVMSNWRASHQFPLNTFKINLRNRALRIDENAFVAQRLKRANSIVAKLRRFPKMRLTQMQDIGGCRAVLSTLADVETLRESFKNSKIKHRLVNEKDYITNPKPDGYRGIHLVYRYVSDRKETYNNHSIEIQIRTKLQHAWATAVETVSTLIGQGLKAHQGDQVWLDFFSLVSAAFAILEGVNGPHDMQWLRARIVEMDLALHVVDRLTAFQSVMKIAIADPEGLHYAYFLMVMDAPNEEVRVMSYSPDEFGEATAEYKRVEEAANKGVDAVLVMADSALALRSAYPNYFGDTSLFIGELQNIIQGKYL